MSVDEASAFVRDHYNWSVADCQCDRALLTLAAEVARLRADGKRLVELLEITEVSDGEEVEFRPNRITSCRVMDGQEIGEILGRMKKA